MKKKKKVVQWLRTACLLIYLILRQVRNLETMIYRKSDLLAEKVIRFFYGNWSYLNFSVEYSTCTSGRRFFNIYGGEIQFTYIVVAFEHRLRVWSSSITKLSHRMYFSKVEFALNILWISIELEVLRWSGSDMLLLKGIRFLFESFRGL